ncbi:arsenate-mycothiol transferase ArsC [Gilvimarinus sp. F26214L]|uniref:arsenate-mycothiol transferase ArsC n=1 Tax=Gilvimarinus sp. DZF01 TaxID=3461371 RepID=UPI00404629D2
MLSVLKTYINDNYGSKRGFLASSKYYCLHRMGYLRELREVEFARVRKLVFVCAGNLCRSPLAEWYARSIGLDAESFGLECRGGDPADGRMIQVATTMGLDVSGHRTRNIRDYRPASDHLVVAMEPAHVESLPNEVTTTAQVTLISLWMGEPYLYLHDPFSGNINYFDKCGTHIRTALDNLKERLDGKDD